MTARTYTSTPHILDEPIEIIYDGILISAQVAARKESDPDRKAALLEAGKWKETFHTVLALPGTVTDQMMGTVTVDTGTGAMKINQAASVPILRQIIDPAERSRFERLIASPEHAIDIKTLWLSATDAVTDLAGGVPFGGSGG